MAQQSSSNPENIDVNDKASCESWVHKLNVTHEQLREAVGAVGPNASDVEQHLKGVRSTTNDDKIERAGASGKER